MADAGAAGFPGNSDVQNARLRVTLALLGSCLLWQGGMPWLLWFTTGRLEPLWLCLAGGIGFLGYTTALKQVGAIDRDMKAGVGKAKSEVPFSLKMGIAIGLIFTIILPSMSLLALDETVGTPRLLGQATGYSARSISASGVQIATGEYIPGVKSFRLYPDGSTSIIVKRFNKPAAFAPRWHEHDGRICIDQLPCMDIDSGSGSLTILNPKKTGIGRVSYIGELPKDTVSPVQPGVPQELKDAMDWSG